jgi:hypothetical protein
VALPLCPPIAAEPVVKEATGVMEAEEEMGDGVVEGEMGLMA